MFWLTVLPVIQLIIIMGLVIYFLVKKSWDEDINYSVLAEEDPEIVPNPYRQVWKEYLSNR